MNDDDIEEPRFGVGEKPSEVGAFGEIVGAGTLTFIPVDIDDGPIMRLAVEAAGAVLRVKRVALNLREDSPRRSCASSSILPVAGHGGRVH